MSDSRLIHKGRVIELWQKKIRLPNGRAMTMDFIKHPGAVLVVPFLNNRQIVFIRQFRPAIKDYLYELPAGTLEKGETPLSCARREIREETGFSAAKMLLAGKIYPVPGYSTEMISIYQARQLKKDRLPGDSDEIIENCIFDKKGVQRILKKGLLTDAKTIAALVFCRWL